MDSPPTSTNLIRFWSTDGTPLPFLREWTPAIVSVDVPERDWLNVRLECQGVELATSVRRVGSNVLIAADWIRSGPGKYRFDLWQHGACQETQVVTIEPRKIGEIAFRRLLIDLETRLPVNVAIGLQRAGGLTGLSLLDPELLSPNQELARLRRAICGTVDRPGLAEVLRVLSTNPHRILRSSELWVRADQVRRPHPTHMVSALLRPGNLGNGNQLLRIIDSRPEQTTDTYENRLLKLFSTQVLGRARLLVRVLQSMKSDAVSEAQELIARIDRALLAATFLEEVRLLETLPTTATMVLLRQPPYLAALTGYLEFQRHPAVYLDDPTIDAPLESLPSLYQTWCTLQVIDTVLQIGSELGHMVVEERLTAEVGGGVYVKVLSDNAPALKLRHPDTCVEVIVTPERMFGANGSLHSVSFQQRPDITIEIRRPDGSVVLFVLDPKYKLDGETQIDASSQGDPMKVDVDKMHAYRDAIRDRTNVRLVKLAAVLYPGSTRAFGRDVFAVRALPGEEQELAAFVGQILREELVN